MEGSHISSLKDIINKYTTGELTLDAANKALSDVGAGFSLQPEKNILCEAEKRVTTVGYYPEQANGYGFLDTGTGFLDKVQVQNGQLVNCDCGNQYALFSIAGKTYRVHGSLLVE